MNDLVVFGIPLAAFVILFFIWLVQTRQQAVAVRRKSKTRSL